MKKKSFAILLCGFLMVGLITGCDSKKKAEEDLQNTIEKYGFVEKETVETLVAKFNTEVMNNSGNELNPAFNDYLTIDNDQYWYGLTEGIYLVVTPTKFNNDKTKDIVNSMTIYVQKDKEHNDPALAYTKHLIKANNNAFTDADVNTLIDDAKQKSSQNENANNGKGISVGYVDNEDNYQYSVKRLYK